MLPGSTFPGPGVPGLGNTTNPNPTAPPSQIVSPVFHWTNIGNDATAPHKAFLLLGAEVTFVVALAVMADHDPRWGTLAIGLLATLWFVWFINNAETLNAWVRKYGV